MYEQLHKLGFSRFHLEFAHENSIDPALLARVISTTHENYLLQIADRQTLARLNGKLRFTADSASDFPVTGDWVCVSPDSDELITGILPRRSFLARSAVGRRDQQILAANLDTVVIVMAADRDFNLSRIDRYLALILDQGIVPVIFLNKIDLIDEAKLNSHEAAIFKRHPHLTFFSGSILENRGIEELAKSLSPGFSFCVVGSSGVGKSSLINYLAESQIERVKDIGTGTRRGRHTTTTGHLHVLANGAIMIDTPGLREVGITDAESGIQQTFAEIEELAAQCRFSDCTHMSEPGCAVQKALAEELILPEKFASYQKLKREAARFGQTIAEKRQREKGFGKMVREVMKFKKENRLIE